MRMKTLWATGNDNNEDNDNDDDIENTQGKGRGLVATRTIRPRETILVERQFSLSLSLSSGHFHFYKHIVTTFTFISGQCQPVRPWCLPQCARHVLHLCTHPCFLVQSMLQFFAKLIITRYVRMMMVTIFITCKVWVTCVQSFLPGESCSQGRMQVRIMVMVMTVMVLVYS